MSILRNTKDNTMTVNHNKTEKLFDSIAFRYDFLNSLFSASIHRNWIRFLVQSYTMPNAPLVCDVCAGTSETTIAFAKEHPQSRLVAVDISDGMLQKSYRRIKSHGLSDRIKIFRANGLSMPFQDQSFDVVVNTFGLRNEHSIEKAVCEMVRVLKRGGQMKILEFSLPNNKILKKIYLFYLIKIMPAVSRLFLKDRRAFDYLARTICEFPPPKRILAIMDHYGLTNIRAQSLTGGIATLYQGQLA